ncbi:hypothetical protein FUA23_10965 [Neolewinella aurantiaca]|uniref:CopG-like ribbon-helix-helix domain-containing protein n=1 Tax=Neolewinella aurantiaca TaxID=2602767 RepID=A0A5C7FDY5_9BACT|nr:hypothetical protein [Neolewinella aurantiaca]TXF89264.1 hypothetical protein FUA23_10965 [Neolewinella aurantiaca]
MSKEKNGTPRKKLSKPIKDPRIAVNMRLPSKILELLRYEAIESDRSATSIVVELLRKRYEDDL